MKEEALPREAARLMRERVRGESGVREGSDAPREMFSPIWMQRLFE